MRSAVVIRPGGGRSWWLLVVTVGVLVACASTDHSAKAEDIFSQVRFGQPYTVERHNADPADPGVVSYRLLFRSPAELDAVRGPKGFGEQCGLCDLARSFNGPEPGSDTQLCEITVMRPAQPRVFEVLITCGPGYGDP